MTQTENRFYRQKSDVVRTFEDWERLSRERDEAIRARDLAREASNRDLEAKREALRKLEDMRREVLQSIADSSALTNRLALCREAVEYVRRFPGDGDRIYQNGWRAACESILRRLGC